MRAVKETLKNGLRIIYVKNPESLTTTIGILVGTGSDYETKELNGISHFLEHMCFKGTERRKNSFIITSEFESLGARYNAFTSREYTSYYAKVKNDLFNPALDAVVDIYLHSTFPSEEIEKERGVIIEEINMYEDDPQSKISILFDEFTYGDTYAGRGIAGKKENIKRFTRTDFLDYHKKFYVPNNTVIFVSGNFNQKKASSEIKKIFSKFSSSKIYKKEKYNYFYKKTRHMIHFKESDQTHLVIGFQAFPTGDKRRYALSVLRYILGGGMSSRLFQKIREEMGAAYYIGANIESFSDRGMFVINAGLNHEKTKQVIKAIFKECNRISKEGVTDAELLRAKQKIARSSVHSFETSDEIGYYYAFQELLEKKLLSPSDEIKNILSVKRAEVLAVARDIFKNELLTMALLGPFKQKDFNNSIVKV